MGYTLKVNSVVTETEDTVTLKLKQPALKKIKYLPGQYLTLVVNVNGRKYRRPYSFSSAPGVDPTLDITIKRVHKGVVSNYLNDSVREGDLIEVLEPMGDFVFTEGSGAKRLILWGAGSGITPLYSILKSTLSAEPGLPVVLVYCNRDLESSIFRDELRNLADQHRGRLKIFNFFTRDEANTEKPFCYFGRVDRKAARLIMDQLSDGSADDRHYICGPHELKEAIRHTLRDLGTPDGHIFSEEFDHVVNEEDLKDVHTQQVLLHYRGVANDLQVVRGKSILEAGLDLELDLPYSCQNGSCKECKAKLIAGRVKMTGVSLHPESLDEGEYLLCCSYPLTADVELSVG